MNPYEKKLIEHYHNPKNYGHLTQPHFTVEEYNPSCGDRITIEGYCTDATIEELRFTAEGCIISKATASLLTTKCTGQSIIFIKSLNNHDILNLIGINLGPLRLKCALLPLQALQSGIAHYSQENREK